MVGLEYFEINNAAELSRFMVLDTSQPSGHCVGIERHLGGKIFIDSPVVFESL